MKLYWSSRSPFVRKVMVAAHELGLAQRITTERMIVSPTSPNAQVMQHNPLGRLPTLLLDDGSALYDSRVICEHLDAMAGSGRLFPASGPARIDALRRQALADGLLDTMILWLMERNKPADQQQAALINGCRTKLKAVLEVMERDVAGAASRPLDIGALATAVALSYLDFRFASEGWRDGRAGLAAWHAPMIERASFKATEHADIY